jgi:PAS domain S-box-containing protein
MKFNIAAKLGFLAALVSLAATGILGLWSLSQSRRVLTEHELGDLTDETELRVYELMNDFRYLRKELREVALPPGHGESRTRTVNQVGDLLAAIDNPTPALQSKADSSAKQLIAEFDKMLSKEENDYYLELCCIRVRPEQSGLKRHPPLLAVGRRRARERVRILQNNPADHATVSLLSLQQQNALAELLRDAEHVRAPRSQMFPIQGYFIPDAARDGVTPMLLTIATPLSKDNSGMPPAMLLLTIDFEQFIRYRSRFLPRHLVYLTDDAGRLLIHPNRERQLALRQASARGFDRWPTVHDEPALESFEHHFDKRTASVQQQFRKEHGAASNDVPLKDVHFSYAMQKLDQSADRAMMEKHWKALGDQLLKQGDQHDGLRFYLPSAASETVEISHPDAKVLDEIEKDILAWQKEQGWNAPAFDRSVRCEHFAIRFTLLNPDLDSRDTIRVTAKENEESPRFFGMALAAGREEIENDIVVALGWMYWVILGLGVAAALVAWGFSRLLTRPLNRIIRATEAIAASGLGTESTPLPVHAHDEIGVLARSFDNMREQLKKRREALYETIARMKAILDTAAEGIVIFDDHGQIESFNQAAEQLFGYKAQEINGQKIDTLLATSLPSSGSTMIPGASDSVRMVAQVVRTRGEIEGRRKDGSTFPVEVAFSEVPLQGRGVVTGIFRDITERRKAEQEIRRANEELESRVRLRTFELEEAMAKLETALQGAMEATRAKDAFMASMSHELRTPLTTVIGYAEELQEDFEGEELHEHAGIILGAAKHLLDLINDILDIAKIAAGEMKLNIEEFEVPPLLELVQSLARVLAAKYSNELTFDVATDLGKMHSDQKRVRQILLNLISNACKFTDKGKVTVRAWREATLEGDRILFQVRDSGVGMTPEQLGRLGELFYQVDQSNTRKKGGTGLGMAITKTFTKLMNGVFEVESELGKGSTFTVRLPARLEGVV